MKIKTEKQNIVRDTFNGALLNTDKSGLDAYKKAKKKNAEIDHLKNEVDSIKSDINDIKSLLNVIAEKL